MLIADIFSFLGSALTDTFSFLGSAVSAFRL